MKIARVVGTVVTPIQHPAYDGQRLLAVRPVNPDNSPADDRLYIAVDRAQAGLGDLVLLIAEGSSVRDILELPTAPIRCAIVGVIDQLAVDGQLIYP
ncbi:MAG: microcompartment protein CcmK/EutM [Pseudohongiellaceae bacterium]|jgi:microcompartment protein CcmK/EutM